MENGMEKEIVCPLCSKTEIKYFCQKKGFNIYKCQNCKLLFVYPVPKSIEVYNDDYFSGAEKGFGYVDYDADKEPMVPTFEKYLDIIAKLGYKSGNLLDIGAATGFFMKIAEDKGFETVGIEISNFAAEKGREKGLKVITGDLLSHRFPEKNFDVITMFDVIEHVPDPKALIKEASRVLKNGGLLVINTPDAESLWAKVLGKRWQLIMPPEHVNYFSPKNLGDYLSKNGFSVKLSTKIGKRFTLQYIMKMLYKWQGWRIFLIQSRSGGLLSRIYLPINLHDNFFAIYKKNN